MPDWIGQPPAVGQGLMSLMGNANGGVGYSAPGDPGKAAQTSQATKDRVRDSLTGSIGTALGKTALGTGAALAAGMPSNMAGQMALGGLMSPGSIGGVLGGAIDATLGTTPDGWMGRTLSAVPGVVGGFLGGPIGGLVGGLAGGPLADAMMDGLDMRSREDVRDDYEGTGFGNQARGRQAYADRVDAEKAAAAVRDAVPNSAAAMHAMDQAIAKTREIERAYGISPSYGLDPGKSSLSYGGWGNIGGPKGGASAVDSGYGPSMGGFAGLGIGNPSSYGGRTSSSSGSSGGNGPGGRGSSGGGGYGGHAGGKDGSGTGFGR